MQLIGEDYVVVRQPLIGKITIYMMPGKGMDLGTLGSVSIPAPLRTRDPKTGELTPLSPPALAHQKIAEARAAGVIRVWDRLRPWAKYYIIEGATPDTWAVIDNAKRPEKDGLAIASEYRDYVIAKTDEYAALLTKEYNTSDMLNKAMGMRDGESQLGWISAGLYSVTLAHAQKAADDLIYGGESSAKPININKLNFSRYHKPVEPAVKKAGGWAGTELLGGRVVMATDTEGDGPGIIGEMVASVFADARHGEGLLSATLANFRHTDPIVVLTNFGNKLYTLAGILAAAIVGGGFLSIVPLVGDALASIAQNPIVASATILCWTVGFTLLVVAPWSLVISWGYAILYWLFRLVELIVAAPFWAAMHCAPEGAGFVGQHARRGYIMLLDLVCRPVLLVVGVCVAISGWMIAGYLFSTLFSSFSNALQLTTGTGGVVIEVATTALVMVFFYALFLKFWFLCLDLPDRVLRIIDPQGGHSGISSDTKAVTAGAAVAVGKASGTVGQSLGAAGAAAGAGAEKGKKVGQAMLDKLRGGGGGTKPSQIAPAE